MSVQMVIELKGAQGFRPVAQAIESYNARLRKGIARCRRRLAELERRYETSTEDFLHHMAAEDLPGGDLEYVEWAGEAEMLRGLQRELSELEDARYQLS
ncbi:MAG: hypothetical protein AB1578_00600 [Thermodesulfobacteriota bacterium]